MATLTESLNGILSSFESNAPRPTVETVTGARTDFIATFKPEDAIQVGSKLPEFNLTNALGKSVTKSDLIPSGPVLITFYRGGWCPFCNLALHSLQTHLDAFTAKGVTLVAISPELPDQSLSVTEKHELKFQVLSDVGNKFAKALGIVWKQPDSMRKVFEGFGNDLKAKNGDDSLEVPVPTTLLVDKTGLVRNVYMDADYTKRLEPKVALGWVDAL